MDAQFNQTASLRKSPGCPKLYPFRDYGGQYALRNLKCNGNGFLALARSMPCHNSVSQLFSKTVPLIPLILICSDFRLWALRSNIDNCVVFPIKSNQNNYTQLDSNEDVGPSQG